MGVVYEPVEYGVSQRRIVQVVMPVLGWQLAGYEGAAVVVAVIKQFQSSLSVWCFSQR